MLTISCSLLATESPVSTGQVKCQQFVQSKLPLYKKLYRLQTKLSPELRDPDLESVLLSKANDCETPSQGLIDLAMGHKNKIGIILPLTGVDSIIGLQYEDSIRTLFKNHQKAFDDKVIIVDSKSNKTKFHRAVADMVFIHKPAILLGGVTLKEAKLLRVWSETLQIPTLIMRNKWFSQDALSTKFSFYVSPDQRQMARTLSTYMFGRGLRRYAIIHPKEKHSNFIAELTSHGEKIGLTKQANQSYDPLNIKSIEAAVKSVFAIDDVTGREQELLDLIKKKEEEYPDGYENKEIILPPIIEIDGLVVLDHFKNLRHIASILKYYNVPKMPLLGSQNWRAKELVEPKDPYLSSSVFVDYIGSYNELPYRLKVNSDKDGFFAHSREAQMVDYWLIARHSIQIAIRALRNLPVSRLEVASHIKSLKTNSQTPFFESSTVFDPRHRSHWPTFLFSIQGDRLLPLFKRPSSSNRLVATPRQ